MRLRTLCFGLMLCTSSLYASTPSCPAPLNNLKAINIAEHAMNAWFSGVQKGDTTAVAALFAPQASILHSNGTALTKDQEIQLITGFHLGGYQFTDFCGMQNKDVIVATFASKTFNQDISKTGVNFLSNSKAYRMVVLQKINDQWLIIGYANTNPLTEQAPSKPLLTHS